MSEAVSALGGAAYDGAVRVEDAGLRGMITLRGDLCDAALRAAVRDVTGLDIPGQRETRLDAERGLVWMAPDEMLILVPHAEAEERVSALRTALGDAHVLCANVSDARAVIRLSGAGAREVLAKGAPVDLSPAAFGPGMVRRTRLGQVAAAFWMTGPETFEVVCFRSVGGFVFDWLVAASAPGSLPGHF
ncbi:sarcosine oxidase subunit gamma [Oceanibium sediminis]|uniref:sarcosine oxidase subunit gamma n=1 Tax=Oceanibium sediminis TaxID=2026339 RepID=UPI000DD4A71B|nr:sarcosine oxidase subunit gamma family protein [Oceanibium sediminis]